jgi:hypothetical protein
MFKYALIAATALAATASAASWPMVTVNSAGDIVLNSPTRAQSFQLTASTVTAAPTSGTTVSLTSVTALASDTDNYQVNVPSTLNTDGGYKLPTPTVGRVITMFNDGTGSGAFTVWTSATSVFFGNSVTSYAVASTDKWVRFTATSTTNWAVETSTSNDLSRSSVTTGTASAAATLSVSELKGGYYTYTGTTAAGVAITTPTASAIDAATPGAAVGDAYEFTLYCSSTGAATLTAGTGITFTKSADAYVPAGVQSTFMIYRTAAGAYTVVKTSSNAEFSKVVASTGTTLTPTVLQSGSLFYLTGAGIAVTLPTCTASTLGIRYEFFVDINNAASFTTAGDLIQAITGDGTANPTSAAGGTAVLTATAVGSAAAADGGAYGKAICVSSGVWILLASGGATGTTA